MSQMATRQFLIPWQVLHPYAIQAGLDRVFGFAALIVGLAILATIPLLQFIALGYLLEVSVRIARTGRIRDAVPGLRRAARVGRMGFAIFIFLIPWLILRHLRDSAHLLGSVQSAQRFSMAMTIYGVLAGITFYWASWRGARLVHFLWPAPLRFIRHLQDGNSIWAAAVQVASAVARMPWGGYFRKGLRGFLIGLAWLAVPTGLFILAAAIEPEPGFVVAVCGGIALAYVAGYLPFLQLNATYSGDWRDGFRRKPVRDEFKRAPLLYAAAIFLTLAAAVPLYLLKAESIPRESYWLTSAIFIFTAFPARIVQGWALARSQRKTHPRPAMVTWGLRLCLIPITVLYALIVFLTQYTSWYGVWSLYEQHAFLLPIPFTFMAS
jgi:hypothetical protein